MLTSADKVVVDVDWRCHRRRSFRQIEAAAAVAAITPPMFNGKENEEDETNVHQQTDRQTNGEMKQMAGQAGREAAKWPIDLPSTLVAVFVVFDF